MANPNSATGRAQLPLGAVPLADGRTLRPLPSWAARLPPEARAWESFDGMRVVASMDPYLEGRYGPLLHVSVSYADRLPGWDDLRLLKAAFYGPDRAAMVVLPREALYTNHHRYCHHLWELPEPWETT